MVVYLYSCGAVWGIVACTYFMGPHCATHLLTHLLYGISLVREQATQLSEAEIEAYAVLYGCIAVLRGIYCAVALYANYFNLFTYLLTYLLTPWDQLNYTIVV